MKYVRITMVGLALFAAACATPDATSDAPTAQSSVANDPMQAAARWADDSASRGKLDGAVASVTAEWQHPIVLRLWRDGERYRALIADEDSSTRVVPAVLLTIESSTGWAITKAEPARSDELWPSF